jgi:hypothetical protein
MQDIQIPVTKKDGVEAGRASSRSSSARSYYSYYDEAGGIYTLLQH